MRTTSLIIIFLLTLTFATAAQKKDVQPAPERLTHNLDNDKVPLFVFTFKSPWNSVYGSDDPEFVLYSDGTVIFRQCQEKDNPYSCYFKMADLSPEEVTALMQSLHSDEFNAYGDRYNIDPKMAVSDLPLRLFVMRNADGRYKKITIYGFLSGPNKDYVALDVPAGLKAIEQFVQEYTHANMRDLDFEYFEVLLIPYNGNSKKNIKWPKGFPELGEVKTIKHKKYGRYSLFLHRSLFARYRDVTRKQGRSKKAVLIDGQRFKLATRYPFPSESVWLDDFR
ncbi:MAG: hypothetical protein JSS77_02935 [Acidobacteria bacterium]|nr:hypothetical protein [Acidobacteriota bacterium]